MPGIDFRRRSVRLPLRIAIIFSGTDAAHEAFHENTETLDIGKFGAKVLTSRKLKIGSQVSVRRANSNKTETFRVVHVGEPDPQTRKTPVGLEMSAIEDFWGQSFPTDSW
ncbi:MAG: hypothetical protein DMG21_08775 [Acidobacteria bacterium]|nr:MAG: hypothetical protein DMG21_08775 [Acidobacteriota bacterium]